MYIAHCRDKHKTPLIDLVDPFLGQVIRSVTWELRSGKLHKKQTCCLCPRPNSRYSAVARGTQISKSGK